MTNYYARIVKTGNNRLLVKKLKEAGQQGRGRDQLPVRRGHDRRGGRRGLQLQRHARIRSGPRSSVLFGKIKPSAKTKLPIKLGVEKEAAEKKAISRKNTLDLSYC